MMDVVARPETRLHETGMQNDLPSESLRTLVQHVVARHHVYLREAFPRLLALSSELAQQSGAGDERIATLHAILQAFANETLSHLDKEERVLFPMCEGLEMGRRPSMPPTVRMPIQRMMHEHEEHDATLARLSASTNGYEVRPGMSATEKALVEGLAELDSDLRQHIAIENEVLFPWAMRLEAGLR